MQDETTITWEVNEKCPAIYAHDHLHMITMASLYVQVGRDKKRISVAGKINSF